MKIEHLPYFLSVAATQSLTKSAQDLYTTHQNVSRIIQKLEKELGILLFHRTQQGMALTPAGELFEPIASGIIQSLADYRNALGHLQSPSCDLSGSCSLIIPASLNIPFVSKFLPIFTRFYPEIALSINERDVIALLKQIIDEPTALGICPILENPDYAHFYQPYLGWLQRFPILTDRYYCIVHKTSPLAHKKQLTLAEFCTHPIVFSYLSDRLSNPIFRLLQSHPDTKIAYAINDSSIYMQTLSQPQYVGLTTIQTHTSRFASTFHSFVLIPFAEDLSFTINIAYNQKPDFGPCEKAIIDFLINAYPLYISAPKGHED